MRRALLVAAAWLVHCGVPAQEAKAARVDFTKQVLPILETRCFECHRAAYTDDKGRRRTPKGGLRLDGRQHILDGGDNGPVLTAGKSAQSELYTRTVLPDDHDEKMPNERDPLTRDQSETLKRWIDEGAEFGTWVGAAAEAAPPAAAAATAGAVPTPGAARFPATLAENLAPLAPTAFAKIAGGKALVTPIATDSPLLRVEFPGREDEVTDADVASLAPLREHVAVLTLARTKVSDQGLAHLARMPRIVQLDLRETKVTDRGIAALAALPELRQLNLFGTALTDGAVPALGKLAKLQSVHLWESAITERGLAELRKLLPEAQVVGAPALPEPEPAGAARGNRRRR